MVDDFRNGTLAECKDWSAARHRLDHYEAEWLRPIDREQKRPRLAEEFGLAPLIYLADELDPRIAQQRCDLFAEIGFIDLVDFGCDLQGNAKRPCYPNGTVGPFFGRDSAEKRDVAAARIVNGLMQIRGNTVMYGRHEVGVGDRPPLIIRDRHQRHLAKADIERLEVGKVLPTVKSCHCPVGQLAKQREMELVDMEMLNGHPLRIATTRAVDDDCVITRLEKATMLATIHNQPEFSELFMSYLLTRNSRIEEDLIDQLFNSSEKRLARLLLLLANFGKEGTPEPIVGKYSQEMLAEMIGTTRSRVSFFMNRFRKLGFIEYNGKLEVHKSLLNMVLHENPEIKTRDEATGAE